VTEKTFNTIVDEIIDTAELDRYQEVKHQMVAEHLRPYFEVTPDNVERLPQPYDRTHGGRVSKEGPVLGRDGMPIQVQMEAVPYNGDLYFKASDVIELAQKLQIAGEGFSALISHLTPMLVTHNFREEGDGT
jgi:hypothetical protein